MVDQFKKNDFILQPYLMDTGHVHMLNTPVQAIAILNFRRAIVKYVPIRDHLGFLSSMLIFLLNPLILY